MNILVIFPKFDIYRYKPFNEKMVLRSLFTKWIALLCTCGCTIEYLHEDELGGHMINQIKNVPEKRITLVPESDIKFLRLHREFTVYSDQFINNYDYSEYKDVGENTSFAVPMLNKIKDKNKWISERLAFVKKRHRYNCSEYMNSCKAVLFFSTANYNYCSSRVNSVSVGDGRLYVDIDVSTGIALIYYGGVAIDEDILKIILKNEV